MSEARETKITVEDLAAFEKIKEAASPSSGSRLPTSATPTLPMAQRGQIRVDGKHRVAGLRKRSLDKR